MNERWTQGLCGDSVIEMRNAFEDWTKTNGIYCARRDGLLVDSTARLCWDVWRTAWQSAVNAKGMPNAAEAHAEDGRSIADSDIHKLVAEIDRLRTIAQAAAELIDTPDDVDAWANLNSLVKGFQDE